MPTVPTGSHFPTAVVTGASRGLGRETARVLTERGYRVYAANRGARWSGPTHGAIPVELDVTSDESVAALAKRLADDGATLDVLVNNAGISMDGFDANVARGTLDVNFFGALRVTTALEPLLAQCARVVMVSSGLGELDGLDPRLRVRFADPALTKTQLVELARSFVDDVAAGRHRERGWPSSAYRVSKVSLNALTRILAKELAPRGISVVAVCPGWVATDMGGAGAPRSVAEGALSILWGAEPGAGPSGGFFRDGRQLPF
jgi:carbonyl reductase 1